MGSPEHQPVPEGSWERANDSTASESSSAQDAPDPVSTCRDCGRLFGWEVMPSGKCRPIDPDGRIHFVTCPARPRRELDPHECTHCHSRNVRRGPGNPKVPAKASLICLDCGRQRWLPNSLS